MMQSYLASTAYIDWQHPEILAKAKALALGCQTQLQLVNACFEFVKHEIKHSWDYQLNPITCKASDVLKHKTGFCYAKSHLLAALLRAHHIPTGLCYQRLTVTEEGSAFCLHGLNAVFLETYGWYRIDARGDKANINAQCTPPIEHLAFAILQEGEADLPEIWPEPLPMVIETLEKYNTYIAVSENLPDISLIKKLF